MNNLKTLQASIFFVAAAAVFLASLLMLPRFIVVLWVVTLIVSFAGYVFADSVERKVRL